MRLRRLEVENFRGIKSLDWRHISKVSALVGPGDSGKSTILDAIERVLTPRWSVVFDDADFWDLLASEPIVIRATITDLPSPFYSDDKFGLHLHGFDERRGEAVPPSGEDGEEFSLVVALRVDSTLEPVWEVIDSNGEAHPFRVREREALGLLRVGGNVDSYFGWSRGSALTRLTETGSEVGGVLAQAARHARSNLRPEGLEKLAASASQVEVLGRDFGASLSEQLTPHLDASSLSVNAGALSLHSGKIPIRRAGFGTKRLLAVAMQRAVAAQSGLTIIDEFEHGLEPHRIRRLLRALRGRPPEDEDLTIGQVVLTTHSPIVVTELDSAEIAVVRRDSEGNVKVGSVPGSIDYVMKRTPGALFARKVIVAEGATEVGFLDALDQAWTEETGGSFGYYGVVVVDGEGGTQPSELAGSLVRLGYEVALFVDSDAKAKTSKAEGAVVLAWPGGLCTEERLAADLPAEALRQMVVLAHEHKGRGARDSLAAKLGLNRDKLDELDASTWLDAVTSEEVFRLAFGQVAKSKAQAWFKTSSQGYHLGTLVLNYWNDLEGKPTQDVVTGLRNFAHG